MNDSSALVQAGRGKTFSLRSVSLLAGLALILLAGLVIQARSALRAEVFARTTPLAELLPAQFGAWKVRDDPVSSTAEMARAVDELLHYDEALVRTYERNGEWVSVYIAYWKPGRFHPRLVATHTPDKCWKESGMIMKHLGTLSLPLPEARITQQAQYRQFSRGDARQYVVYWHLLGGRLTGYTDGTEPETSFFKHLRKDLTQGQQEQYFIRIATSSPPEEMLRSDQPLTTVLGRLEAIGLEQHEKPEKPAKAG